MLNVYTEKTCSLFDMGVINMGIIVEAIHPFIHFIYSFT